MLAPKTTTGPRGICINRRSGFGTGVLSGIAVSILASTQDPSFNNAANIFNWLTVRILSPSILACGKPVSLQQTVTSSSPCSTVLQQWFLKNLLFQLHFFFYTPEKQQLLFQLHGLLHQEWLYKNGIRY